MRLLHRSVAICTLAGALSTTVLAQRYMRPFTTEVSASFGGTFDLPGATAFEGICQAGTNNCVQQAKLGKRFLPTLNGEVALALNRFFWLYGDYSYVLPDRQSATASLGSINGRDTVNRHYWMATGGMELSFPTVHGLVPLLRVGYGEIHNSYNNFDVAPNTTAPIIERFESRNIPAATAGGGVRWYLGERHGIRIMANGFLLSRGVYDLVPSGVSKGGVSSVTRRSGGDVTVGYFFQFGGRARATNPKQPKQQSANLADLLKAIATAASDPKQPEQQSPTNAPTTQPGQNCTYVPNPEAAKCLAEPLLINGIPNYCEHVGSKPGAPYIPFFILQCQELALHSKDR